ncbi:MAG: hypothetical protein AAF891_11110 [Pseudomonadota bacterium]
MAYADSFDGRAGLGSGSVDTSEIERILKRLVSLQTDPNSAIHFNRKGIEINFDEWKTGQVEFAKRLARISAEHARRAEKLRIRHRRVSMARRTALMIMVIAINLPIFL